MCAYSASAEAVHIAAGNRCNRASAAAEREDIDGYRFGQHERPLVRT
jgi:hypothetical protein